MGSRIYFTENESNLQRLWGQQNASPWVKDAFHQYVVDGNSEAVNPARTGTKAAARYILEIPAGGSTVVRLRHSASDASEKIGDSFESIRRRLADADEFYSVSPPSLSEDEGASTGRPGGYAVVEAVLLYDVDTWLKEHEAHRWSEKRSGA
jgi:hypothetical protein